jgi:hypothetical protein
MKQFHLIFTTLLFSVFVHTLSGFNGLQRFSDDFYAAQKYFYKQAKLKYPKIAKEKAYPEVPLTGAIKKEELSKILPMPDFISARRSFLEEVKKYPEQLYPEIFRFLYNHPALQVSASNKMKFEALECYFTAFNLLFTNDPYFYYHPQVKHNPCPVVFCYTNDKNNQLQVNLSNASKIDLYMMINQGVLGDGLKLKSKNPLSLKPGSSQTIKCEVNLNKLKSDSTYSVLQLILADPSQPKIKLIAPVILLPSKEFLNLPGQFFNLKYTYTSHVKNIDLYSDRTSGPERCNGKNCSGEVCIGLRNQPEIFEQYAFGDVGLVQFKFSSTTYPQYREKNASVEFELNELGELQGKARDCPGPVPESIGPCPPESANNGKQLYGSRKVTVDVYVPKGKPRNLLLQLEADDFKNTSSANLKLSWLGNKKLMVQVIDSTGNFVLKEIIKSGQLKTEIKSLAPGKYTCSVFPATDDKTKHIPGFEINHLNQAEKGQFHFRLKGKFVLRDHNTE